MKKANQTTAELEELKKMQKSKQRQEDIQSQMLELMDIQSKAEKFLKTFLDIHEKEKKKEEKRV